MNNDITTEEKYRNNQKRLFEEGLNQHLERGKTIGLHQTFFNLCGYAKSASFNKEYTVSAIEAVAVGYKTGEVAATFDQAVDNYNPNYKSSTNKQTTVKKTRQQRLAENALKGKAFVKRITKGVNYTEEDIYSLSPTTVKDLKPTEMRDAHLSAFFKKDDICFCGTKQNDTGSNFIKSKEQQNIEHSHFITNPLSGIEVTLPNSKTEKDETYIRRRDADCTGFCNVVVEHDDMDTVLQLSFAYMLIKMGFPVVTVTDSAGKSIHTILRIQIKDYQQWCACIKDVLFDKFLLPFGFDGACSNPARLTRLAGHLRVQKDKTVKLQKLLYLNNNVAAMPFEQFIALFKDLKNIGIDKLLLAESPLEYYETYRESKGEAKGGFPLVFDFRNQMYRGTFKVIHKVDTHTTRRLLNCRIEIILTSKDDKVELHPQLDHKIIIYKPNNNKISYGEISADDFTSKGAFKKKLGAFDCVFLGSEDELSYLAEYLFRKNRPIVRKVSGMGYDLKSDNYIYQTKMYDKNGNEYFLNKDGYFKDFNIIPFNHEDVENIEVPDWKKIDIAEVLNLIYGAYSCRGFTMLSFWIATTFAHIIFSIWRYFVILNVYGISHKGKSEFAQMLFWMFFIDDDGITCDNSKIGSLRKLSQFKNIPVQINEADIKALKQSGINIKNLFHWRPLRSIGDKNHSNTTSTLRCRTGTAFNQNDDIFILPEEKNRTATTYFSEDCTNDDTYLNYEKLTSYSPEQFAYIGHFILSNRVYFEENIKAKIIQYSNELKDDFKADERLRNSHAQLMGSFHVFIDLLVDKNLLSKELAVTYLQAEYNYIKEILLSRIEEIRTGDSLITKFFTLLLNQPDCIETGFRLTTTDIRIKFEVAICNLKKKFNLTWNNENTRKTLKSYKKAFRGTKSISYHNGKNARLDIYDRQSINEMIGETTK